MKKFNTEVHLSREMSLLDATMIGVGAMIGAGIFVLTGIAAGVAGPALIIAFILNGIVALLTAMSYAELGSCFHDAGGGYLWVKEGLPKWNGFLAGWMSWFAHAVACSLYALGFGAYFEEVLREFAVELPHVGFLSPQKLLAVGIALVFSYINFRGASETGKVGNLVTITKIVMLAIFIGFGLELILRRPNWTESFSPFMPNGWGGVIKAMGLTFIAFQGFEVISQASEEIRNPKKNIPRAVFFSILIVVPIYVLTAIVSLGAVHPEGMTPWEYLASHKETALVEVARTFFIGGGIMLLAGGLISTMSALNATIYSSSRVAFAMGRDRNFPTYFGKVHAKKYTPHFAIVFSLGIVLFMTVSFHIEDVASAADIMFLLLFMQVNITLIRLRKKRPDLDRGFVVPFLPYITILGILMLVFLAIYMLGYSPLGWLVTLGWIAAGLLIYKFYAADREIEHVRKVSALQRLERKEYKILVAVSNPKSTESLLSLSTAIAKPHNGEIIALHVIEVPEHQPLRAGLTDEQRGREFLERAVDSLKDRSVPIRTSIKISHRISQGILETIEEEHCNFVLLGRNRRPTFLERFFSSSIYPILQEAPCEVAVLHGTFNPAKLRKIYLPFGFEIHSRLALEIAPSLLSHFKSRLKVGVVFEMQEPEDIRQQRLQELQTLLRDHNIQPSLDVAVREEILHGILHQSRNADLLVMGGRSGDLFELLFVRSLGTEITENASCPVLWLKEYEEPVPFWKELLKPFESQQEGTQQ